MNPFFDIQTVEETKNLYRLLAKKHHPDLEGGSTKTMQELNQHYHEALKRFHGKTSVGTDGKDHQYRYSYETEEAIIQKIHELLALRLPNTQILLIGSWVWITGDTKPVRDKIKMLGCSYHSVRECWYWHEGPYRSRRSNNSLQGLAEKYGCTEFNNKEKQIN